MLTANKLMPQGAGLAPVLIRRAPTVALDWDTRQKSRFEVTDTSGRQVGVFLPRGTVVRGGDVLVVEDGSLLRVLAAPQPVLQVTHCSQHGSPFDLLRAAYHLGNRHVPIELRPDHLKIEPDHVLADLLRAMHLIVHAESMGFEPEAGAYTSAGHSHHAHDSHEHGGHDHAQPHAHAPEPAPAAAHQHGPGCGHDHGPAHAHDPGHTHAQAQDPDHGHSHSHRHGHDHGHRP